VCEKRIHALGGPDYESSTTAEPDKLPCNIKKTSFAELMSDTTSRDFLLRFMNQENSSAPLRLWITIEEMLKEELPRMRHCARGLYNLYFAPDSPDPISDLPSGTVKDFVEFAEGLKVICCNKTSLAWH
jgi:hypothetical protein